MSTSSCNSERPQYILLVSSAFLESPRFQSSKSKMSNQIINQTVHSQGIYHGLPTYDSIKPQVAIITGANGISGFHTLRVLADAPERWSKIYALSRRPPPPRLMDLLGSGRERVEHVACDFLSSSDEIAKATKGKIQHVDAIFFYSYLQPGKMFS